MPPSTDTHVRSPSTCLRAPTVYSATPARATSERPGSTKRCGSGSLFSAQRRLNDETIASA